MQLYLRLRSSGLNRLHNTVNVRDLSFEKNLQQIQLDTSLHTFYQTDCYDVYSARSILLMISEEGLLYRIKYSLAQCTMNKKLHITSQTSSGRCIEAVL